MEPEAPETSEEEHLAKRARHNLEGQDGSAGGEAVGGGQDGKQVGNQEDEEGMAMADVARGLARDALEDAGEELEEWMMNRTAEEYHAFMDAATLDLPKAMAELKARLEQEDEEGEEEDEDEWATRVGSVGGEVETGNAEGGDGEEGTEEEGFSEQEEEEEEEEEDEDDEEDDDEEEAQDEEQQQQQQEEEEEDGEEDEEGGVGGEAGEGGEGGYDQYDEDEEEIAAMQRVTDLLETCSEDQLHKLFFDAVMRYKDDILLGHDEARNDLLVSACVQHPDFEQQIEAICTKNMKLMEQGGEDDPVELSSDESENADAADAEGAAGAAGGIPDVSAPEEHGGAAAAPDDSDEDL